MPTNLRQCPNCAKKVFVLTATACIHCGEELPADILPSADAVESALDDDPTGVGARILEKKITRTSGGVEGSCGGGGDD